MLFGTLYVPKCLTTDVINGWLQWPLISMPNQQLYLINSFNKETSPILSFLFIFTVPNWCFWFQLHLHIPKKLNPNPFCLTLKGHPFWAPIQPFQPYFLPLLSLESTTPAKLNHDYLPRVFPLPCLVHFIPSWNVLLIFTIKNSNPFHHFSRLSSNVIKHSLTLPN